MSLSVNTMFSPAMKFISTFWNEAPRESYRIFNSGMHQSVQLAIESGMKFNLDDFAYLASNYKFGYWAGKDGGMYGEGFYSDAVRIGNISACLSFEQWRGREPFIWLGERIYLGRVFPWLNHNEIIERIRCTGFSRDGLSLRACAYEPKLRHLGHISVGHKVREIYKITKADIRRLNLAFKDKIQGLKAIA